MTADARLASGVPGDRTVTQYQVPQSPPCSPPLLLPLRILPFWEACFSVFPWYSKPTADCSDKRREMHFLVPPKL